MPHQPPQRRLVQFAAAERGHQRQPQAAQLFSQVTHGPCPSCGAGDGTNKKPRPNGGVLGSVGLVENSARAIASPREGTFFHLRCDTRKRDHSSMMRGSARDVNLMTLHSVHSLKAEKKPGP